MEVQKVLDNFWNAEEEAEMSNNFDESQGATHLAQHEEHSIRQETVLA
jgi:hypothetical protein